eukprot:NODE_1189_length_1247_cov_134.226210_g967_i0.p6 GENE.NODE_1189_length_1247_cov_134.226210_g967_i0~~NODE_1189_length_1247_cov_134.226210_g967_i0.p6  ORF type:complete len:111 (-),score=33.82 NODE_1189_length_1247_cov_134.226210_g967_i0:580-912(-)
MLIPVEPAKSHQYQELVVNGNLRISKGDGVQGTGILSRDIPRTFPDHPTFASATGIATQALYNVLAAYAEHDPDVGYVQGMAFIVATLLLEMAEEPAFWAFESLMSSSGP